MGRRSSRGGCGVGGLGGIGGGGAGGAAHHWRQTRSASPRDGAAAVRRGGEGVRASGGAEGRGKAGGSSAAATATARPLAGGPWRGGRASGCNFLLATSCWEWRCGGGGRRKRRTRASIGGSKTERQREGTGHVVIVSIRRGVVGAAGRGGARAAEVAGPAAGVRRPRMRCGAQIPDGHRSGAHADGTAWERPTAHAGQAQDGAPAYRRAAAPALCPPGGSLCALPAGLRQNIESTVEDAGVVDSSLHRDRLAPSICQRYET